MNDTEPTDSVLMHEIRAGNENAFVMLYQRRQHDVYRFAYTMSSSASIAQDVTQDVFLNVLQNASRFDAAKGSVRAWLLGCARYVVLDRMRLESKWCGDLPEEPSVPCDGEQEVFERQRLDRLYAAISTLPIEYREAIVLCELEELSYAECASVLGCPIGTVRSRLHRARALLAARLAAGHEDVPAESSGRGEAGGATAPQPPLTARGLCT